jgi:hypothetical protein
MIATLLSGAWWVQKLSGVTAKAIGVTIAVALVMGSLWWLRHDARMDERVNCVSAQDQARVADLEKALAAARASEAIARAAADKAERDFNEAAAARQVLMEAMTGRARVIVYPKDIVKALNR